MIELGADEIGTWLKFTAVKVIRPSVSPRRSYSRGGADDDEPPLRSVLSDDWQPSGVQCSSANHLVSALVGRNSAEAALEHGG